MSQEFREFCRNFWHDALKHYLKFCWVVLLTVSFGFTLFDGTLQKNLAVMSDVTWKVVLQNALVLAAVAITAVILMKSHPLFRWSWLSLLGRRSTNIGLAIPLEIKYFGLLFVLLFAVNVPSLALTEEEQFRLGTQNWFEGLYRSVFFGLVHCSIGIPLGAGLAISIAGMWFTYQYLLGGLELSTLHHATYNLIVVSLLFFALILNHISGSKEVNESKGGMQN